FAPSLAQYGFLTAAAIKLEQKVNPARQALYDTWSGVRNKAITFGMLSYQHVVSYPAIYCAF
ncbi:hypothetical protein, partial [Aeromonas caviae]|uniref:hypothetical protein n=1 Tax=Aeromonas caviae TaxID=648 RepID=UPI0029DE1523